MKKGGKKVMEESQLCFYLYYFCFCFFLSCHLYGYCRIHIPTFFPFILILFLIPFLLSLLARGPPLENVTAVILSYAVSHLHEGPGKLR